MLQALELSLAPSNLALGQLYLDPNNPRFAGDETPYVPDEDIGDEGLQEELLSRMAREFGLAPLMDSIEHNGYLPIDRIVVRQFRDDKYVILEGNRRVAAAKLLRRRHDEQPFLSPPVLETLKRIPVVLYTGQDPDAAWVFQGVRHISGPKDWPAYQKARLVVEQMEKHRLSFTNAGLAFGLSAYAAGQYIRGYYAYQQALSHHDYDDVVDPQAFPYFQELFGRSNIPLREWLEWDDGEKAFRNQERFAEFLSWLYPKKDEEPDQPGDWGCRRVPRAIDLRSISDLEAEHPEEFSLFRRGLSLSTASGRAAAKESIREKDAAYFVRMIEDFAGEMNELPMMKIIGSESQVAFAEQVQGLIGCLGAILDLVEK